MFRKLTSFVLCAPLMAACMSTPEANATSRMNVVEPGDASLGCPELTQQITQVNGVIAQVDAELTEAKTDSHTVGAITDMAVANGYAGPFGNLFGPAQAALARASDGLGQQRIGELSQELQTAQQRRHYLASIYNQRCF